MRLQEVGGRSNDLTQMRVAQYLNPHWHRSLSPRSLQAYVRYLFIARKEGLYNWEDPAHTRHRPLWDGGRDSFNTQHKSVWVRVADAIRRCRAAPGVWVAAHFSGALFSVREAQNKGTIAERPLTLCSDTSAAVYEKYCERFEQYTETLFASAEASLTTRFKISEAFGFSYDDRALSTLCDTTHVNASPFLRHAFAAAMDCPRAVKRYAWAAACEYEAQQLLYDNFIASRPEFDWLVTDELKKLVAGIRKYWMHYDD